jgi:hypothetical protein
MARTSDILDLGDGRIIVTGSFDFVDGEARGGICMLDTNGNLLNDAFVGASVGQWLYLGSIPVRSIIGITQAPDGSFYIYGSYHGYNDGTNNYPGQRMISRLYGLNVGVDDQFDALRQARDDKLELFPNPGQSTVGVVLPPGVKSGTVRCYAPTGELLIQKPVNGRMPSFDTSTLSQGLYLVQLQDEEGRIWDGRWVKE